MAVNGPESSGSDLQPYHQGKLSNKIKLSLGEQGDMKINTLFPMGVNVLGKCTR